MNITQTGADGVDAVAGEVLDRIAPDEPEHLALVDGPPPEPAEWLAAVDAVLRKARRLRDDAPLGAGVEALTWSTPDGIAVRPLYTAGDAAGLPDTGVPGARPFVRGARAGGAVPDGWDVRTWHADADPHEAILADLANGATSIWLAVGGAGTSGAVGGAGTPVADLPTALDGVLLDLAPVVLDTSASPDDAEAAAEAYLQLGNDPATLRGTLGLDPVGVRARTGAGPDVGSVVPLARRVAHEFPLVRAVVVDGLPVHAAGGSDAQELGYVLAGTVAYLRALTAAGLAVDAAARLLELRVAVTAEQFPAIAKLRAARRVWSRVLQASGAGSSADVAPAVHAVASPTMYTRRDPYVNLLRGTVAGFAAGVGGADAVTVAPFDAALGGSTPFSRRIARNTQSLLVMEAHLARVIDPAGGSWYVESLTDGLARAAWAFFQELEAAGGVVAALDDGLLADRIAAVRAGRERAAATRKAPVTGVSEFPDLHEKPVPRSGPDLLGTLGLNAGGLPVHRPAAAFESFRDRSDALLTETGTRPRAFLATLGPLAVHAARAGFARNLLHAGGIDTADAGPTEGVDDVVAAFRAAGTPVAVLCSSDALYTERAAGVVAALRAAGARHVLLAGKANVDGLDGHLHAGGDALGVLEAMYEAMYEAMHEAMHEAMYEALDGQEATP